jgi:hypothetical protein
MASDHPRREFKINEEPLFPETVSETDSLERRLDDGTIIRAEVAGSRIVGYTARDGTGKPLPVYRMRISDGKVKPRSGPISCYYCICNPGCQCWPEPCPIV